MGISLSAQIIPERILTHYGAELFWNDGSKLTDKETAVLIENGFDYERFLRLNRSITNSWIAGNIGGVLLGVAGIVGRKGEHKIAFASLAVAGSALGVGGIYYMNKYEKQIESLIGAVNEGPLLGFTPSGFAIVYSF